MVDAVDVGQASKNTVRSTKTFSGNHSDMDWTSFQQYLIRLGIFRHPLESLGNYLMWLMWVRYSKNKIILGVKWDTFCYGLGPL